MSEIVVGAEDSDEGREALRFAKLFTDAVGANLHVASVHSDSFYYQGIYEVEASREAYFLQTIGVAEEELGGGFKFHQMMDTSVPAGLTRVAEELDADAVIIGSSHRGPFGRALLGDSGSRLASGAPCAVVVVPRGWGRDGDLKMARLGIAYDGTGESEAALASGSDLAARVGASMSIVGVIPRIINPGRIAHTDRGYEELLFSEMEKTLGAAADRVSTGQVETRVMTGDAADELGHVSENLDLLVIGSRGYGPIRRVLLGGTSLRVARSAACPVMIVPKAS